MLCFQIIDLHHHRENLDVYLKDLAKIILLILKCAMWARIYSLKKKTYSDILWLPIPKITISSLYTFYASIVNVQVKPECGNLVLPPHLTLDSENEFWKNLPLKNHKHFKLIKYSSSQIRSADLIWNNELGNLAPSKIQSSTYFSYMIFPFAPQNLVTKCSQMVHSKYSDLSISFNDPILTLHSLEKSCWQI